jgi:hypothetical protein
MPSAVYDGSTPSCDESVASKRYLPLSSAVKFLGGFVAERIADDDERSPVLTLVQPWPHIAIVEVGTGSAPCRSASWSATHPCGSMNLPQASAKFVRYQVDVMRFDVGPERLEDVPALLLGGVCRLAEVAIELVEAVKLRLVGAVHRGGVGIIEAALVQVAKA